MPLSVRDYLRDNPQIGIANPDARMLRNMTVEELSNNKGKYIVYWDHRAPCKDEELMVPIGPDPKVGPDPELVKEQFEKYLKRLVKKGAWMGAIEIAALASKLDIPIRVWTKEGPGKIHNEESKHPVCNLQFEALHYEYCQVIAELIKNCTLDVLGV